VLVLSTLIFIISIFIIAKKSSFSSLEYLQKHPVIVSEMISLEINGCVQKPGIIQIPKGASLGLALKKAKVKKNADLSNFDLDRSLSESCAILIPPLEKVTVEIIGCVEKPICVQMPLKSRICDLKKRIVLTKDADPTFIQSKRQLKNNDVIRIPEKSAQDIENKQHSRLISP
jgi:hypothetical protein